MNALAALICGLIFGFGLLISGMMHPAKVLAFLDIAGPWDPSLLVVMASALVVAYIGFTFAKKRERPLFAPASYWPGAAGIDVPLVGGSVLFGIGWGLVGLCPGPALENIATGSPKALMFVLAMAVGMIAHNAWSARSGTVARTPAIAALPDG